MSGVVREGDLTQGHCFNPTPPASFSSAVTVNGRGVVRYGDSIVTHCCGPVCHSGIYIGQHEVTVEGRSIQIKGDPISCGDVCNECSSDVTVR
jgi:uncharacterized Zn-binding protein involved in type VI secretion